MQDNKLKHISEIINSGYSDLEGLSETANEKSSLSKYLKNNLKNFGRHIVSAYINNSNILVIKASSPEFAARLKYEEKDIKAVTYTHLTLPTNREV